MAVVAGLAAWAAIGAIASVSATGTFTLDLHKKTVINDRLEPMRGMHKRDASTVQSGLFNIQPWSNGGAYYTNVTVGTPPQTLTVILDTGSSDLYVDASTAIACQNTDDANSCRGGSFNPGASKTYKVVQQGGFNTSFGDGSVASGDYSTDVVGIGNVEISDAQMGVATFVNSTTGFAVSLLGIGYSVIEAVNSKNGIRYPNIPEVLVESGAINSRLYSIFLNQYGDATGSILFGGVDTSLYTGELQTMNMLPVQLDPNTSMVIEFVVAVTGVTVTRGSKSTALLTNGDATGQDTGRSLPVLLDTGSAAWTVPSDFYQAIAAAWGSAVDKYGNLPCSHQNDNVSLSVEFGGLVTITIPSKDLVVPLFNATTNQPLVQGGQNLCTLVVSPDSGGQQMQSQGFLTLGDAVLRSMYVVFDMDNAQVSIAQANKNPGSSNVKVVSAGANGVASAVGSNGVKTAAANTNMVPTTVKPTASLTLGSASPPVGAATGVDAVPADARASMSPGVVPNEGTGTASGGAAATSSHHGSAAVSLRGDGLWSGMGMLLALWAGAAVVGAGLIF